MKIIELISDESKYDWRNPAVDRYGKVCSPSSDWAVKWSVRGALFHCYRNLTIEKYIELFEKVKTAFAEIDLTNFKEVTKVIKELKL